MPSKKKSNYDPLPFPLIHANIKCGTPFVKRRLKEEAERNAKEEAEAKQSEQEATPETE